MKNEFMCGECKEDHFKVRGMNKREVTDIIKMHVKNQHGMNVTDAQAKEHIKPC